MKAGSVQAVRCCVCDEPKINYAAHTSLSVGPVARLLLLKSSMVRFVYILETCMAYGKLTCCWPSTSMSRLVDFWKFLPTNFNTKVVKYLGYV